MTQKLAQLLNLPPDTMTEESTDAMQQIATQTAVIEDIDETIDKIDAALPMVKNLDSGDKELDDLSDLAKNTFNELIDLGMNIDPRFAGVIFQTAGTLLGHAITAKTAKMDKKIKMVQLQLQKAKLDHQINGSKQSDESNDGVVEGKGMMMDRNDLLAEILSRQKGENK